jgi:hypothetical protein
MQFSFSLRNTALAAALLAMAAAAAHSQQAPPPASEPPAAPAAQAPPADPVFPKPDPHNFNADSPSVDTVNDFLKQTWGFDPNRVGRSSRSQRPRLPA